MARQLVDYKPDTIDPFSFRSFVKEIGQERIGGVFEVTSSINPTLLQRVILLMDGSHICTCRSLQNAGLVCAHFFATMVFSDESRYHIGLINRRWFLEKWQDDLQLESDIKNEPFVHAKSQLNAPLDILPAKRFMDSYLKVFPAQQHAIRPPVSEAIKERRVAMADEALRSIRANVVNGDQGSCDRALKKVFRFCSIKATEKAPSPSNISDSDNTEESASGLHKELDNDVRESSSSNTDTTNDTHSGGDSNYSESGGEESSYDSCDSGKDGPGWIDPAELVLGSRFDDINKDSSGRRQRSEEQGAECIRDPHRVAGKGRTKGKRNKHRAEIISDMNKGKMPFSGSNKRKWSNDPDGEIAVIKRPSHCSVCGMPGHNRATCLSKKACLLEEKRI